MVDSPRPLKVQLPIIKPFNATDNIVYACPISDISALPSIYSVYKFTPTCTIMNK